MVACCCVACLVVFGEGENFRRSMCWKGFWQLEAILGRKAKEAVTTRRSHEMDPEHRS